MRSSFSTNWTLLVIHSGRKSRYCMSLSRFLNICRPVSAEWTSIILTFPAEIWVGEGEGDKDGSVTREKEKQQSRKREGERDTSPVTLIQPHATRGWWLFGQRGKQEGKGKMGKIRKCWGWRGVCTLEASPHPLFTSIHNSIGAVPTPLYRPPGHSSAGRTKHAEVEDTKTPPSPPPPHTHTANSGANTVTLENARAQQSDANFSPWVQSNSCEGQKLNIAFSVQPHIKHLIMGSSWSELTARTSKHIHTLRVWLRLPVRVNQW